MSYYLGLHVTKETQEGEPELRHSCRTLEGPSAFYMCFLHIPPLRAHPGETCTKRHMQMCVSRVQVCLDRSFSVTFLIYCLYITHTHTQLPRENTALISTSKEMAGYTEVLAT